VALILGAGYQDHKVYFNGCTQEEVMSSKRNGTHGMCVLEFIECSTESLSSLG
jgi:hypothetical protein